MDNTIGFPNAYPRDSDLSSGHSYPPFEQLEVWAIPEGRRGGKEKTNVIVFIISI